MSDRSASPVSEDPDFQECPCSGRTLSKLLQPAIMTVLAEGPLHGYVLVARLASLPTLGGAAPDSTGVYRMLHHMEASGFVASAWDTSASGPARKTYRLTAQGLRCLGRWVATLEEYASAIGELLGAARRACAQAVPADGREGGRPCH